MASPADSQLTRAAGGRLAPLGGLFDFRNETFLGGPKFYSECVPETLSAPHTAFQVSVSDTFASKVDNLHLEAELAVSMLCGLGDFKGGAKFLKQERLSGRVFRCHVYYTIRTKKDRLDMSKCSLPNADAIADKLGTHFVAEIEYGAQVTVTYEFTLSDSQTVLDIDGMFQANLALTCIPAEAKGKATLQMLKDIAEKSRKVNITFDGDIVPLSTLQQTPDEAEAFLKRIPDLMKSINEGAGVPVSYTLYPIKPRISDPQFLAALALREMDGGTMIRMRKMISDSEEALSLLRLLPANLMPLQPVLPPAIFTDLKDFECVCSAGAEKFLGDVKAALVAYRSMQGGTANQNQVDAALTAFAAGPFSGAAIQKKLDEVRVKVQPYVATFGPLRNAGALLVGKDSTLATLLSPGCCWVFHTSTNLQANPKNTVNTAYFLASLHKEPKAKHYIVVDSTGSESGEPLPRVDEYIDFARVRSDLAAPNSRNLLSFQAGDLHVDRGSLGKPNSSSLKAWKLRCPNFFLDGCQPEELSWKCARCGVDTSISDDLLVFCLCGAVPIGSCRFRCCSPKHLNEVAFDYSSMKLLCTNLGIALASRYSFDAFDRSSITPSPLSLSLGSLPTLSLPCPGAGGQTPLCKSTSPAAYACNVCKELVRINEGSLVCRCGATAVVPTAKWGLRCADPVHRSHIPCDESRLLALLTAAKRPASLFIGSFTYHYSTEGDIPPNTTMSKGEIGAFLMASRCVEIKTSIKENTGVFYRINISGYDYGSAKPLDCIAVGYTFQPGSICNGCCTSSFRDTSYLEQELQDGRVVLKLFLLNAYHVQFSMSSYPPDVAYEITSPKTIVTFKPK